MANKKFQKAFDIFIAELKKDKDLYFGYQSNIAMAFVDEARRQYGRDSYKKLHAIANAAAKNFLDLLIRTK